MAKVVADDGETFDVIVVGGAVMGASVAFWLTADPAFDGRVLVVERDPSFTHASSALSASGIRQQFSQSVNVQISHFGAKFITQFPDIVGQACPDEPPPNLSFRQNGYLYCWSPSGISDAQTRTTMQNAVGAQTQFLTPAELRQRYPYLDVSGLGGATWGSAGEGWFDPFGLMTGFKRVAQSRGVTFIQDEVVDLTATTSFVSAVTLKSGRKLSCGHLVNAAGPAADAVCRMAGIEIPVEPRKRHCFVFDCKAPPPHSMPMVVNLDGTYVRPEGNFFITGRSPDIDGPADAGDFETEYDEFDTIWPSLAERIPAFEAIKLRRWWTGHYAFNTFDQNAIIGPHPRLRNFMFANGFSGHGLQQAPAVGRGLAEMIVHGRYETIDLSPLKFGRIPAGKPLIERAII